MDAYADPAEALAGWPAARNQILWPEEGLSRLHEAVARLGYRSA